MLDPYDPSALALHPLSELRILPLSVHAIVFTMPQAGVSLIPNVHHGSGFGYALGPEAILSAWTLGKHPLGATGLSLLEHRRPPPARIVKGFWQPSRIGAQAPAPPSTRAALRSLSLTFDPLATPDMAGIASHLRTLASYHRTAVDFAAASEFYPDLPWLPCPENASSASSLRLAMALELRVDGSFDSGARADFARTSHLWTDAILDEAFSMFAHDAHGADFAVSRLNCSGHHEDDLGLGPFNPERFDVLCSSASLRMGWLREASRPTPGFLS